jgi:hypothetical protein
VGDAALDVLLDLLLLDLLGRCCPGSHQPDFLALLRRICPV